MQLKITIISNVVVGSLFDLISATNRAAADGDVILTRMYGVPRLVSTIRTNGRFQDGDYFSRIQISSSRVKKTYFWHILL